MSKTLQSLKKRNPDKVDDAYRDSDGYWIELAPGWRREPHDLVHMVHEDTVAAVVEAFRRIVPCDCGECKTLKAKAGDKSLDALFGEALPERAAPPVKAWWEASYIPQSAEEGE
jgi:hypothetical protein